MEGLKDLALSLHVPVVALSAVDRAGMEASRLCLHHLGGFRGRRGDDAERQAQGRVEGAPLLRRHVLRLPSAFGGGSSSTSRRIVAAPTSSISSSARISSTSASTPAAAWSASDWSTNAWTSTACRCRPESRASRRGELAALDLVDDVGGFRAVPDQPVTQAVEPSLRGLAA